MARFSDRMVPEVVQVIWAAMTRGRPRLMRSLRTGSSASARGTPSRLERPRERVRRDRHRNYPPLAKPSLPSPALGAGRLTA